MKVVTEAIFGFSFDPEVVYELVGDHEKLPLVFKGAGPVPAVTKVQARNGGSLRLVEHADGSVIRQRLVGKTRNERMEFEIAGFKPPLSFLARSGGGVWEFRRAAFGCVVRWRVHFTLTTAISYLPIRLLLDRFYNQAMYDCMNNMHNLLLERRTELGVASTNARSN